MNTFGNLFKVSIYGTSHNDCFGILIDGIPAGIKLDLDKMNTNLARRKPQNNFDTKRIEEDAPIIKSGLFNGYTNGTPLVIEFENKNQRSNDYENLKDIPRPSQADYVANMKYNGFNDYRGGGAFSGRLTAAIVAAGSVASQITGFDISSKIENIGGRKDINEFDSYLEEIRKEGDSIGGIIELTAKNVPVGLGEPYFCSAESQISSILYSIGGVKGVSFGVGFDGVTLKGSAFNDRIINEFGKTETNNAGGINGGITNGNDIIVKVFVKPISSIYKEQETFNFKANKMDTLKIEGRHDASILKRVMPVLEAALHIALADLYLLAKAYK